jgi:hypothetical protein
MGGPPKNVGSRGGIIVLQEEPSFLPSLHQPGHGDLKVWIHLVLQIDMDDHTS